MRIETSRANIFECNSLPGETTDNSLGKLLVTMLCLDAKGYDMKEHVAPESNNTLAGKELTGRLPKMKSDEFSACAAFIRLTLADFGSCLTIAELIGGGGGRRFGFGHLLA